MKFLATLVLTIYFFFGFQTEATIATPIKKNFNLNKIYGGESVYSVMKQIVAIDSKYATRVLNKKQGELADTLMQVFVNETVFGQVASFNGHAHGICQIEQATLESARKKMPNFFQYLESAEGVNLSQDASWYVDKPKESLLLAMCILEYKHFYSKYVPVWRIKGEINSWSMYKTYYNSNKGKAVKEKAQEKFNVLIKHGYASAYAMLKKEVE